MRNIFLYTLSSILLLTAVSCSQEIDPVGQIENGTITLSLRNAVPQTRTMLGVDDLNENLIESIHYFFYPQDGTDTNTENEPVKWDVLTGLSSQTLHSFRVNVSEDLLKNELFKYPYNDCDVYIIVNLPETIDVEALDDHKLSTLKALAVQASFNSSLKQDSFVMDGLGVASIIDRKKILAAEGTIEVDRLAAKVSVGVSVRESITTMDNQTSTNNQTWTSVPKDMVIEFVNGVSNTILSGNPDDVAAFSYFNDANPNRTFSDADGDKVWTCAPFYSYPSKWDIGSEEEPYLRITLPWQTTINTGVDGNDPPIIQTEKCIYKVILDGERLNRNTWNDLTIDIGILGNFENQEEVLLPIENTNYFVADWSDGKAVNSEILGGRYLVVDEEEYVVYNQDEVRIPFTTSHTCEIVDMSNSRRVNQATVIYPDYSTTTPNVNREINWQSSWYLAIENNEIVLKHALRNDISQDDFDYAPYTFKFTIRHTGVDAEGNPYGDVFYKDITIVQYPAMVIEAQPNRELQGTGNYGGTYVNSSQNNAPYGGLYTLSGNPATKNPNMYVIKASVLPSDSDLIIGDPRSLVPTDFNNNSWATAPCMEGGADRKLQNYYRTLTTSDVKYMIAPKFRTASSHGVCNSELSYTNAEYRCASYQEDGYPAGRWRIPTLGEVQFMVTLSNEDVIPELYSSIAYWYAGGIVNNNNGNLNITEGTTGNARVRCVYDEWYWENPSSNNRLPGEEYAFTWGDAVR